MKGLPRISHPIAGRPIARCPCPHKGPAKYFRYNLLLKAATGHGDNGGRSAGEHSPARGSGAASQAGRGGSTRGPARQQQQQQQWPGNGSSSSGGGRVGGAGSSGSGSSSPFRSPRRGGSWQHGGGSSRGGAEAPAGPTAGPVLALQARLLTTRHWRQLTDLLPPLAGGAGGGGSGGGVGGPVVGGCEAGAGVAGGAAGAEAGVEDVAAGGGVLTEAELLAVLWRVVGALLLPGGDEGGARGGAPGMLSVVPPLPPAAASVPYPERLPGWAQPLQQQQQPLLHGFPSAASPPWQHNPNTTFPPAATASTQQQPYGSPTTAAASAASAANVSYGAGPLPEPLTGSSVARHRCLEALRAAVAARAPYMSAQGTAAALGLLGSLAAGAADGDTADGSGRGAVAWQLAAPLLAAAATAVESWVTDGAADSGALVSLAAALPKLHCLATAAAYSANPPSPTGAVHTPLTHAVLAAVLNGLCRRAQLVLPPVHELCVCAAAAARCGLPLPAPWLALLHSELRNQIFLLTPCQGAVALAAMETLAVTAAEVEPTAAGTAAAEVGREMLLPRGWVESVWAEVSGKVAAAATDAGACVEALTELAWYGDAGLLPPPPPLSVATAVPAGVDTPAPPAEAAAGRVGYVYATLCVQLSTQLESYVAAAAASGGAPGARLAALITTAAQLWEYGMYPAMTTAGVGVTRVARVRQQRPAGLLLAEAAAVVLCRRLAAGELTWVQLAACTTALAALAAPASAAVAAAEPPEGSALAAAATAPPSAAAAAAPALAVLAADLPQLLSQSLLAAAAAAGGGSGVGPEELVWLPRVEGAVRVLEGALGLQPQRGQQRGQQRGPEELGGSLGRMEATVHARAAETPQGLSEWTMRDVSLSSSPSAAITLAEPAGRNAHAAAAANGTPSGFCSPALQAARARARAARATSSAPAPASVSTGASAGASAGAVGQHTPQQPCDAAYGSLAKRLLSYLLAGLDRLELDAMQLLRLVAAIQHPCTADLFDTSSARCEVLLALLSAPLRQKSDHHAHLAWRGNSGGGSSGTGGLGGSRVTRAGTAEYDTAVAAAAAAVLPGTLRLLDTDDLIAVLHAASQRQVRFTSQVRQQELQRLEEEQRGGQQQQRQQPQSSSAVERARVAERADPIAAAVLSFGLAQLLDLASSDYRPGYMYGATHDASPLLPPLQNEFTALPPPGGRRWSASSPQPRCTTRGREPSPPPTAEQWHTAVTALADGTLALASPAALAAAAAAAVPTAAVGGAGGGGGGSPDLAGLTPAALLRLLRALAPVWRQLHPDQTADMAAALSELHAAAREWARLEADVAVEAAQGRRGRVRAYGGGWRSGAPEAEDWQAVQCAVADAMYGMSAESLAEAVTAAAELAEAAPLREEWVAAVTEVLVMAPPQPPAPLAGGLKGLTDAGIVLELLLGCMELERVQVQLAPAGAHVEAEAAVDAAALATEVERVGSAEEPGAASAPQVGFALPVLPLLQRLGALLEGVQQKRQRPAEECESRGMHLPLPPSAVCQLLPRLAQLASTLPLAAAVSRAALPLLSYLQRCAFSGASVEDLVAALAGIGRLLLRPSDPWVTALCDATFPLLRPAVKTPLHQLSALSQAMAAAWVVPTAEWHAALAAATLQQLQVRHPQLYGTHSGRAGANAEWNNAGSRSSLAVTVASLEQLLGAEAMWFRLSGSVVVAGPGSSSSSTSSEWVGALVAASVPLLPAAAAGQPGALGGLPYWLHVLGYDPGPDFISALLQGCSRASLAAFTAPQLARLSYGLAGLGYQPEDPWVTALQRAAASKLDACDPHDLLDLLEGVLVLAEGCEGECGSGGGGAGGAAGGEDSAREGAAVPAAAAGGGGGGRVSEAFLRAFWRVSSVHLTAEGLVLAEAGERRVRRTSLQAVQRRKADFRRRTSDPRVGPFWRYWTHHVPLLDPSLAAPDDVVVQELARLDLPYFEGGLYGRCGQGVRLLRRFLRWRVLREGTREGVKEQPGRQEKEEEEENGGLQEVYGQGGQGRQVEKPQKRGQVREPPAAVPLLQQLPPEGIAAWAGCLAAGCVELLGGGRAAPAAGAGRNGAAAVRDGSASSNGRRGVEGLPPQQQQADAGVVVVAVAPPAEWVRVLMLCQSGAMMLQMGAEGVEGCWGQRRRRRQLLAAAQAAVAWGVPPPAEWGEAFLAASRHAFFASLEEGAAAAAAAVPAAAADVPPLHPHRRGNPRSSESPESAAAPAPPAPALGAVLQLLLAVLSLQLAPGAGWLGAAEAASLPLLEGCRQEEAVALALALQRLQHTPSRTWAAQLLRAVRPHPQPHTHPHSPAMPHPTPAASRLSASTPPGGGGAAAGRGAEAGGRTPAGGTSGGGAVPLPPVSLAALLVALAEMRVRPYDSWMEGALAGLYGRQAELPAPLLSRLLAALAALEVKPAAEWLGAMVDAFWAALPDLFQPSMDADVVIMGLSALSALDVPVKQHQLGSILELMSERVAVVTARDRGNLGPSASASPEATDLARILMCLAGMRRATPNRVNRRTLDNLFAATAEMLPVSGPITPGLLQAWDELVPM